LEDISNYVHVYTLLTIGLIELSQREKKKRT
jgi:hypothetical protein